jgi:DNA-binding GntR family transcriptional regulator
MFIRRALEADAVRAVAARGASGLFSRLEQNLDAQRRAMRAKNHDRFHALDLQFHALLLEDLGYERVKAAVEAARANLDRMRLFLCTPARTRATFAEHRKIVTAIHRCDPAAAARAMEEHLDAVMRALLDFATSHAEVVAGPTRDTAAA